MGKWRGLACHCTTTCQRCCSAWTESCTIENHCEGNLEYCATILHTLGSKHPVHIIFFQQGHCSHCVSDENFKIQLQILQVLTPHFHSYSVSALCEGWLQCIAWVMLGLLTQRNSHLQNLPPHFARIWENEYYDKLCRYFKRFWTFLIDLSLS